MSQRASPIRGVVSAAILIALATASPAPAIIPHTEEAVTRGLVYVMQDFPQAYGYLGFGCGFADLDGDGDPDVVIIGAKDRRVGLFENDGTGHFTDRSLTSGIPLLPAGSAFAAADYDGDGDLDLYFTQTALSSQVPQPSLLLRNDGAFQFTDVTAAAGVGDLGDGKGAAWGDLDGDGWLDLYVCNYNGIVGGANTVNIDNKLYRNLGDGTFEDISAAQGVGSEAFGFQPIWFDYDRDGDPDLYISNDRGPLSGRANELWRNDDGQLVDVSVASGAGVSLDSMGVACGDFDGNGWPDLYCTNVPGVGGMNNPLLLNQGDGTFIESGLAAGVDNPPINGASWGSIFYDYDNDGRLDLYVNNMFMPNTFYSHDGAFPCLEIAVAANVIAAVGNCSPPGPNCRASFGSAVADVDNDGDMDLLVNNLGGNVELFINHDGQTRNWIKFDLVGQGANRFAVGGSIDTRVGGSWLFREIIAGGNGYLGQNELIVHVGLGAATVADEVVVVWPNGDTRTLTGLQGNRTWRIYPLERLGDGDGDGQIDSDDVAILVAVLLGADSDPDHFVLNDMNGDGAVNGRDLQLFVDAMLAP